MEKQIAKNGENMENIGEVLRKKREAKKITIDEVSEKIKIVPKYLEALEENNFSIFSSDVYTKLFLKSYAKYLDLNYTDLIGQYNSIIKKEQQEKEIVKEKPVKDSVQKKVSLKTIAVYSMSGIILVMSCYYLYDYIKTRDKLVKVQQNKPVPSVSRIEIVNNQPFILKLIVKETTWLEIKVDGNEPEQMLLSSGIEKEWRGQEKMRLWIGNAGGIELYHNGKKINLHKKSGETIKFLWIKKDGSFEIIQEIKQ